MSLNIILNEHQFALMVTLCIVITLCLFVSSKPGTLLTTKNCIMSNDVTSFLSLFGKISTFHGVINQSMHNFTCKWSIF